MSDLSIPPVASPGDLRGKKPAAKRVPKIIRVTKPGKGVKDVDSLRLDAYLGSGWTEVPADTPVTTEADTAVPEVSQAEVDAARPAGVPGVTGDED